MRCARGTTTRLVDCLMDDDKRRRPKRSTAKKKKTRLFCLWNETTDDEYVIVFLSLSQVSYSRTMGTPFFARLT